MFYVTLCAECTNEASNQTKVWTLDFTFRDEAHFSTYEDTGFDDLIETFNRHLPLDWQVDDVIEVQQVHGSSGLGSSLIITVD